MFKQCPFMLVFILILYYSEKHELHKSIEKLALELQDVRGRQEELRSAKQEAVRELLTLQVRKNMFQLSPYLTYSTIILRNNIELRCAL